MQNNIPAESLVGILTNTDTPLRPSPLSKECGVIVLTHVVRSLNLLRAETLEELWERRESAALLVGLRLDIQRESNLENYP